VRINPALSRQIAATKRELRRARRGQPEGVKDAIWLALKGLTELRGAPMRPGLAERVAMSVRFARQVVRA
jgi:hypothetical protein